MIKIQSTLSISVRADLFGENSWWSGNFEWRIDRITAVFDIEPIIHVDCLDYALVPHVTEWSSNPVHKVWPFPWYRAWKGFLAILCQASGGHTPPNKCLRRIRVSKYHTMSVLEAESPYVFGPWYLQGLTGSKYALTAAIRGTSALVLSSITCRLQTSTVR